MQQSTPNERATGRRRLAAGPTALHRLRLPASPLGVLVLLSVLHGLLWVSLVPPWQVPDEPKHFELVRLMSERGEVIVFATEQEVADFELQGQILASMDDHHFWWYGHAPRYDPDEPPERTGDVWVLGSHSALYRSSPVYYWLAARVQLGGLLTGLYAARMLSVLLGALVVLFTAVTARELFPDDPLVRYGAPAFVALHPMFAFLHSGVNNDVLANFLAALAFLVIARLFSRGGQPARLLLIAIVVLAAVLTKRTSLVTAPVAVLAVLLWLAFRSRRPGFVIAIGSLVGALGLGSVWAWWSAGGAAAVPEAWRFAASRYFLNNPDQLDRIAAILRAEGVGPILLEYAWRIHNGFWGSFGWELIGFPTAFYLIAGLVGLVALAGVIRQVADGRTPAHQRAALTTFALAVLMTIAGAVAFFAAWLDQPYPTPPQGRYLFVAMVPMAIIITAGLSAWVPAYQRGRALLAFVAAVLAYDLLALAAFVVPFFYR